MWQSACHSITEAARQETLRCHSCSPEIAVKQQSLCNTAWHTLQSRPPATKINLSTFGVPSGTPRRIALKKKTTCHLPTPQRYCPRGNRAIPHTIDFWFYPLDPFKREHRSLSLGNSLQGREAALLWLLSKAVAAVALGPTMG